jgi:putative two-component system response regulator
MNEPLSNREDPAIKLDLDIKLDIKNARILIVDDEPVNVVLLERVLRQAGYQWLTGTTDPRQVASLREEKAPDIILLDLQMPYLTGFDVLEQLQADKEAAYLPVLVLTADITPSARQRALSGGAKDFVTKPFDQVEVLLRVRNLLETRLLHLRQRDQNRLLEEKVKERTRDLERSQGEMLQRLAEAAEFRDDDTGQHTQRVGEMAAQLTRELGLGDQRAQLIFHAAPLHDVGKIGIADAILLKPGKLAPEEFEIMKTHAAIGAALLKEGHSPLVQMAHVIALTHHEKWDGSGYPQGLRGQDIPIEGRITAVVDVFDALTHERPYKNAWPIHHALAEIEAAAGAHFDPEVTRAFQKMLQNVLKF